MNSMHCALRSGRLLMCTRARPLIPRHPIIPASLRFAHASKPLKRQFDDYTLNYAKSIEERTGQKLDEAQLEKIDEILNAPLSEEDLNDPDFVPIELYQQDPNSPTGESLVLSLKTREDWRRQNDMYKRQLRWENDPEYDDPILRRHLFDSLLNQPALSDFKDDMLELEEMWMNTPKSKLGVTPRAPGVINQPMPEMPSGVEILNKMEALDELMKVGSFSELIKHPKFELVKDMLPGVEERAALEDPNHPDYEDDMTKFMKRLSQDEKTLKEMDDLYNLDDASLMKVMEEDLERQEAVEAWGEKMSGKIQQMWDTLGGYDGLRKLQANIERPLEERMNDDPEESDRTYAELRDKTMALKAINDEMTQLSKWKPGDVLEAKGKEEEALDEYDDDGQPKDPVLEAKVDEIMNDPKLMEKLLSIYDIIAEEEEKQARFQIPVDLAPDPTTLPAHRLTTIQKQFEVARSDPEHRAALKALRVKLLPPFNVAPALRLFNNAMQYAYVGANDDIRRILWRAYRKARSIPTFLQNIPDDAWDILYYSQAVKWNTNQNRDMHLRLLLQDLESVGKDGPPTHPSKIPELQKQ